jgi:hypothetical protein
MTEINDQKEGFNICADLLIGIIHQIVDDSPGVIDYLLFEQQEL